METTKLKLIEFIINEASEAQIQGLEELLMNNDISYGMELILGGKEFDNYLKTQARYIYQEDISHTLANLNNGDIEGTKKLLEETLNK